MVTQEEIELAKQGNEEVLEKIIKQYQKNIYFIRKGIFSRGGDSDDIIQEKTIGLLKAIKNYDIEKKYLLIILLIYV